MRTSLVLALGIGLPLLGAVDVATAFDVLETLPCRAEVPIAACEQKLECGELIRLIQFPSSTDNGVWTGFFDEASASTIINSIEDCNLIPQLEIGDCISLNNGSLNAPLFALRNRFQTFMVAHPCPNVRVPERVNPSCAQCGATVAPEPVDSNGDGVVTTEDCGMLVAIPTIPCDGFIGNTCNGDPDTLTNFNSARQVSGFVHFLITSVSSQGLPKFVDGIPLCITNEPPSCDGAVVVPTTLWPPNSKFRSASISGVSDPDGDQVTIIITAIRQDESVKDKIDGDRCPDGVGVGTGGVGLRAERSGSGDGRVYHVSFAAEDGHGGECVGTATVCVPHDQGAGVECIDQGPLVDSTGPC